MMIFWGCTGLEPGSLSGAAHTLVCKPAFAFVCHETVDHLTHHHHGDAFLASAQCTQASHVVCAPFLFVTINSRLSIIDTATIAVIITTVHYPRSVPGSDRAVPCGRGPDGA